MIVSVGISLVLASLLALFALGGVFKKTQSMSLAIFCTLAAGMLSAACLLNLFGLAIPVTPIALVVLSAAVSLAVGAITIVKTGSAFMTATTSMLTGPLFLVVALSMAG
jgi:hypothetical protein